MRTIKQDTVNRFWLFRARKYARILKEAQEVNKAGIKMKQEKFHEKELH